MLVGNANAANNTKVKKLRFHIDHR